MFHETRTERFARRAYDLHEGRRRETLLRAIEALKRAREDNAASILHKMLEGDPDRPLAGDEREMLDAEQPHERNPGGAP